MRLIAIFRGYASDERSTKNTVFWLSNHRLGFFAVQIRVPQIYVSQSQIYERFGERRSERLLQIHVFNYMKILRLIPGKSYVIYFYKATKVWLGLVCLLACACVCLRVLASTNDHRRILFCTTCVVFFKGASVATTYNVCVLVSMLKYTRAKIISSCLFHHY